MLAKTVTMLWRQEVVSLIVSQYDRHEKSGALWLMELSDVKDVVLKRVGLTWSFVCQAFWAKAWKRNHPRMSR